MFKTIRNYIDLKLLGLLILFYSIFSLVSFIKVAYLKINGYSFQTMDWGTILIKGYGYDLFIFILFTIFIIFTTKKMIEKKIPWKFIVIIHFFFSFFFGIFTYFGSLFISISVGDYKYSDLNIKNSLLELIQNMDYNFIIYFATISIIYAYNYLNKVKLAQVQKLQLESQLTNTKMTILKSQLHPHFLFNTLNSIHSLMDSDKKKSQDMLVDLSELLREIVGYKEENLIELQDEVSLLKKYLDIIKVRFSDDLKIDLKTHKNLEHVLVPSMMLQPIVENSIKHGFSKNNIKLVVSITIFKEEDNIIFIIHNNGKILDLSLDDLILKGLGIKNAIERLKTLYTNDYSFKFYNSKVGVTTKIVIPYRIAEFKLIK